MNTIETTPALLEPQAKLTQFPNEDNDDSHKVVLCNGDGNDRFNGCRARHCASMQANCTIYSTTTELQTGLKSIPARTPALSPTVFRIMCYRFSARTFALRQAASSFAWE